MNEQKQNPTGNSRAIARRVALDVAHMWPDMPREVLAYLRGDDRLRDAARRAAMKKNWEVGPVMGATDKDEDSGLKLAIATAAEYQAAKIINRLYPKGPFGPGTARNATYVVVKDFLCEKYESWLE